MAAALLTAMLSSTQPHGALAAPPASAGTMSAAWLTTPSEGGAFVRLPPVPSAAREIDTLELITEADALASTAAMLAPRASTAPPTSTAARKAAPAPTRAARPPVPRARVVRAATRSSRLWAQLRHGFTVTGQATWYAGSRGYAGIAHVAMPGARYLVRGRSAPLARVCAGGRCTVVAVVDACACRAGTPKARVADLSVTTLRLLGLDPRRGVYQVRVTLLAP